MTADELAGYLTRIAAATTVPALATVALELMAAYRDDPETAANLLMIAAVRWKRVEGKN